MLVAAAPAMADRQVMMMMMVAVMMMMMLWPTARWKCRKE